MALMASRVADARERRATHPVHTDLAQNKMFLCRCFGL